MYLGGQTYVKKKQFTPSTYLNVDGVKQNPQRAIEIFSEVEEWFVVGEIYRDGIGVEQDSQKAIEFFMKSGAPVSLYAIGVMYRDGIGVKQDGQTAIEFLNKAKAWYPIEEMYRNASGSPK